MLSIFMSAGLFSGLIVASWHGFKDSPWEGFILSKYPRSIILAIAIASLMFIAQSSGIFQVGNYGVLMLCTLCIERFTGEINKGFIRREWHDEYSYLFGKLGLRRESYVIRLICGCFFVFVVTILFFYCIELPNWLLSFFSYKIPAGICSGLIGGMVVAIGGAIKDAPSEGFKFERFIISPIIGLISGAILISVMKKPDLLIASSIGFERVVNETHKTFYSGKNRGIFDGKAPSYIGWLNWRWIFFIPCGVGLSITLIGLVLHI